MNPQAQFCPNKDCRTRGEVGKGHIGIHSQQERRYRCKVCGKTFSETTGTALNGIKKGTELFVVVVTLLAYGCPVQAIVMAFGLDERIVRDWLRRSGLHCQQVHDHMMETQAFDLGQVQADEIKEQIPACDFFTVETLFLQTIYVFHRPGHAARPF